LNGAAKWKQAMTALGFYDALTLAGFAELGVVIGNDERRETLLKTLDGLFATGPRDKWVAILREADIVSAPINTLLEAASDPDVLANGYITEVEYPKHGKKLKVHGSPWQFSETPAKIGVAPELGEHNDAVLEAIGYSAAEIQGFRDRKVI
jgi:crotonobetainyl-CoA:carnitine CoA-transferase CaiB-like acyl-CoA transferase